MLLCVIALIAVIVHNGWSFSSSVLVEAFSANYICQPNCGFHCKFRSELQENLFFFFSLCWCVGGWWSCAIYE